MAARSSTRRKTTRRAQRIPSVAQELRHLDGVVRRLNAMPRASRTGQQEAIDKSLMAEVAKLLFKIRYIKRAGRLPTPDESWSIMLELAALILKLVFKVFWLQGRQMPKMDPKLPNPT